MVKASHISRSDFIADPNEVHKVSHAALWEVRGQFGVGATLPMAVGQWGCKGPWGGHVLAVSQEVRGGVDRAVGSLARACGVLRTIQGL